MTIMVIHSIENSSKEDSEKLLKILKSKTDN